MAKRVSIINFEGGVGNRCRSILQPVSPSTTQVPQIPQKPRPTSHKGQGSISTDCRRFDGGLP